MGQFRIYFADAANNWTTLKTFAATPGQTVYPEPVTLPAKPTPGSTCRIYVYWRSDPTVNTWQLSAKSNAFTVTALPTISFTSPAGGENWLAGTPQTVSFTLSSALSFGQFRIYFADAANKWFTLKTFAATAGQTVYPEPVTLPATITPGSTCRIWVYWRSDPTVNTWQLSAKSNAFSVTE